MHLQCVSLTLRERGVKFPFIMRLKIGTWLKLFKNGSRILAIGACALFYLVGNSPFEAFHKIIHPQEGIVDHTIAQEENSCHRAIYHPEKETGCAHKSHVAKLEKCKLCHALPHSDHVASFNSSYQFIQVILGTTVKPIAVLANRFNTNLPSRGPPVA